MTSLIDCLVIGGGPAGLTAAIYLARYHLSVLVVDDGKSRAELIPLSRNIAGFPGGISGSDLLSTMRKQIELYDISYRRDRVITLNEEKGEFSALTSRGSIRAISVLLATGVVNRRPAMTEATHRDSLLRGLLRYCPICDGYEVTDQSVAVIGNTPHAVNEAEFLRSYSQNVTLISTDPLVSIEEGLVEKLATLGVKYLNGPPKFKIEGDHMQVVVPSGKQKYQAVYPALGSDVRSELGTAVGADVSSEGCLLVNSHQATNIDGLFAAGDVVKGLDQIASAIGHASIAATAIRSYVATKRPVLR